MLGFRILIVLHIQVEYFDQNQNSKAIPYLRRAVQLEPDSETISLFLFHSLYGAQQQKEAWQEMKRFMDICPSEEYTRPYMEMRDELREN